MSTEIDPSILRRPSSQSNSVASCDIQREVLTGTEEADRAHLRRPGANKSKRLYASFTSSRTNASDHRLVNGKAAATRRASGKGGLFPFRSRNLCNETDSDAIDSCSVSNFQQVFNELKAENPLASMGAVQQMTLRRLSEFQKLRKAQQQDLNELAQEAQEDERQIGLAVKTLNKFVDVIRVGSVAPDEGEDHGVKAKGTASDLEHKSHLDDSFFSYSSSDYAHEKTFALMKLAGFRRNSASTVNRQSPQLSSALSAFSDFNCSNDSLILTKPRTAREMYAIAANEQGENMALKRSVSDFSAMLSVGDLSRRSIDSLMSDMSALFLEEPVQSAKDAEAITDIRDDNANDGVFNGDYVNDFVLTACAVCIDDTNNSGYGLADTRRQEQEKMNTWGGIEKATKKISSKFPDSQIGSIDQTHSCQSDARSDLSGLSDCTSACGSDGLIVSFSPRCESAGGSKGDLVEEDDECFGFEGFAADFSAWDKSCER